MKALLDSRLDELRKKSFAELADLPASQSEPAMLGTKRVTVTVWTDRTGSHELRVVVQAYRHWALGLGRMAAQGFSIDSAGAIRDLRPDELYEFT